MNKMDGELFASLKNHQFIMTCQWKKVHSQVLFSSRNSPDKISGLFELAI